MLNAALRWFATLPTAAKLLLILTALLLPIGIALTWIGESGIHEANAALYGRSQDQAKATASAVESLVARNALALRVAAAGAIHDGGSDPCATALGALATAPAITRRFALRDSNGGLLCATNGWRGGRKKVPAHQPVKGRSASPDDLSSRSPFYPSLKSLILPSTSS